MTVYRQDCLPWKIYKINKGRGVFVSCHQNPRKSCGSLKSLVFISTQLNSMHMTDARGSKYNIPLMQVSQSTIFRIENVTHVPTG